MRWTWFGAVLAVRSTRASRVRTAAMASGVALSVFLLLALVSIPQVLDGRDSRVLARAPGAAMDGEPSVLVLDTTDVAGGRSITRRAIAAEPDATVDPPAGLEQLPAPGTVVVSPALQRLLRSEAQVGVADRYPGFDSSPTVSPDGLAGPDELFAYVGVEPRELIQYSGLGQVRHAGSFGPTEAARSGLPDTGEARNAVWMMLLLVTAILIILLAVCIRLSATAQERRLASLRLAGASIRRTSLIVAGEVGVAVAIGTVVGLVLWIAASSISSGGDFGGLGWYREDLRPTPFTLLVVAGVPIVALMISQLAVRRSLHNSVQARRDSPLILSSRPRVAVLALATGLLVVIAFPAVRVLPMSPKTTDLVVAASLPLLALGLPLALPVLLRATAERRARRTARLSTLLAMRWISHQPAVATRTVVLVAAALVTIAGLLSWSQAEAATQTGNVTPAQRDQHRDLLRVDHGTNVDLSSIVNSVPGVVAAVPIRLVPITTPDSSGRLNAIEAACPTLVAVVHAQGSCDPNGSAELAIAGRPNQQFCTADGACAPIAQPVPGSPVSVEAAGEGGTSGAASPAHVEWPTTKVTTDSLSLVPELEGASAIFPSMTDESATITLIQTNGSEEADTHVRTAVMSRDVGARVTTLDALLRTRSDSTRPTKTTLLIGGLVVLAIAALAQIVASLDAAWQRRRSVAILRATGMQKQQAAASAFLYSTTSLTIACALGMLLGQLLTRALDEAGDRVTEPSVPLLAATGTVFLFTTTIGGILARRTFLGPSIAQEVRSE